MRLKFLNNLDTNAHTQHERFIRFAVTVHVSLFSLFHFTKITRMLPTLPRTHLTLTHSFLICFLTLSHSLSLSLLVSVFYTLKPGLTLYYFLFNFPSTYTQTYTYTRTRLRFRSPITSHSLSRILLLLSDVYCYYICLYLALFCYFFLF